MADWIKLPVDLMSRPAFLLVGQAVNLDRPALLTALFRVAGWFNEQGQHGKVHCAPEVVDVVVGVPGMARALLREGWMRDHGGVLTLHKFAVAAPTRKSISAGIRRRLLIGSCCAACGATERLVLDHVIPVVRGGSCDEGNLQVLCSPCNSAKGTKTMAEWRAA